MNPIISKSFSEEFSAAVLLNEAKNADPTIVNAQILCISGPPGSGKSTQIRACAEAMGIDLEILSGSALAGPLEGQALIPLAEAYERAGNSTNRYAGVVYIEDADKAVFADDPKKQHTNSKDMLDGFIMNVCDGSEGLHISDMSGNSRSIRTKRQPLIIMSVNDTGKLYEALTRIGRMTHFTWDPGLSEKIDIVAGLHPHIKKPQIRRLVCKYQHQSVAFFGQLAPHVTKQALKVQLAQYPIETLRSASGDAVAGFARTANAQVAYQDLCMAAKVLNRTDPAVSHLKSGRKNRLITSMIADAGQALQSVYRYLTSRRILVKGRVS